MLGFPCGQFLNQEAGTDEQIQAFCERIKVGFKVYAKILVNGAETHPLYRMLKSAAPGSGTNAVKWNFTTFLCGRDGFPIERFAPSQTLDGLERRVEELIAGRASRPDLHRRGTAHPDLQIDPDATSAPSRSGPEKTQSARNAQSEKPRQSIWNYLTSP